MVNFKEENNKKQLGHIVSSEVSPCADTEDSFKTLPIKDDEPFKIREDPRKSPKDAPKIHISREEFSKSLSDSNGDLKISTEVTRNITKESNINTSIIDYVDNNEKNLNYKKNRAFQKMNDKKQMLLALKNSSPCKNIINTGNCDIKHCSFAHSLRDLSPPPCVFDDICNKSSCNSIHPGESRESWIERMSYKDIFNQCQISEKLSKNETEVHKWAKNSGKIYTQIEPLKKQYPSKKSFSDERINNKKQFHCTDTESGSSANHRGAPRRPSREVSEPISGFLDEKTNSSSKDESLVIIFPPSISQEKISQIFNTVIGLGVSNIEIRKK